MPVQRDKKPKRRNGNINKEAAVRFEHVETGKTWKEAKLHEPQRQIYWKKAGEANGYWTSAAEDPWCVAPRIPEVDWIFAHECFKLYDSAGSQKRVPKGFRGTAKISRSKLTYRIIHGLYKVYGRVWGQAENAKEKIKYSFWEYTWSCVQCTNDKLWKTDDILKVMQSAGIKRDRWFQAEESPMY